MLEIEINILKGVNKRVRGPNLTRSMSWDKCKVPNTGSTARGWKDMAWQHPMWKGVLVS